MRAAIYCRISLDATGEALGVTRQLDDCRSLAKTLDWDVVDTHVDNDISASSGKVRPEYRRMLAAIQAGEVEAVIAWHPDRLYRKLRDLEELIEVAEVHSVTLKTVRAGDFDLGTPTGKMMARILASVSAGEGDIKADRWRRSVRQRRERGDLPRTGPRLFGYDRNGVIRPDEAEHIRWLVGELLDGVPIIRATHRLNERGARTTRGNPWSRPSVAKLLRNGRLAGRSMLNGDIVGRGAWESIIDEETFEQLQAVLDVRRGTVPQRPRVALLLGLIHCGLCGNKMVTGGRAARGESRRVRTYRCSTMPAHGGCGRISIAAEPTEELLEGFARERLADERVRERLAVLLRETSVAAAEIVELEERLVELEAQLDEPGVPVTAVLRAMERTKQRIEDLRVAAVPQPTTIPQRGDWPSDLARRARLVGIVVDAVTVSPAERGRYAEFQPERLTITPR